MPSVPSCTTDQLAGQGLRGRIRPALVDHGRPRLAALPDRRAGDRGTDERTHREAAGERRGAPVPILVVRAAGDGPDQGLDAGRKARLDRSRPDLRAARRSEDGDEGHDPDPDPGQDRRGEEVVVADAQQVDPETRADARRRPRPRGTPRRPAAAAGRRRTRGSARTGRHGRSRRAATRTGAGPITRRGYRGNRNEPGPSGPGSSLARSLGTAGCLTGSRA